MGNRARRALPAYVRFIKCLYTAKVTASVPATSMPASAATARYASIALDESRRTRSSKTGTALGYNGSSEVGGAASLSAGGLSRADLLESAVVVGGTCRPEQNSDQRGALRPGVP